MRKTVSGIALGNRRGAERRRQSGGRAYWQAEPDDYLFPAKTGSRAQFTISKALETVLQ